MKRYWIQLKTLLALGPLNVLRVFNYRLGISLGYNRARRLRPSVLQGIFFDSTFIKRHCHLKPSGVWQNEAKYFGRFSFPLQGIPDWLLNPFTGVRFENAHKEWWRIPDFDSTGADIKIFWEASRFDWCLSLAEQANAGNADALRTLNTWIANWFEVNSPYRGPNWKCGQEASIRVMHLFASALILNQLEKTLPALLDFVELHLERIAPTISYAVAQNNNHGTSEAAALFLGGSWLASQGRRQGTRWQKLGSKWLENRVAHLVAPDGSFSQYSLNYHRMMLDTLCLVEVGRRHFNISGFSECFYERAKAATLWLYQMIDLKSGDGPNLGANDGARIIPLTESDYRDFRPSVQLAAGVFFNKCALKEEGDYNLPLRWLGLEVPMSALEEAKSQVFDNGGYVVLRRGEAKVLLRYPRFKFRPSQADLLHVDLWVNGKNLLRDAGTYSYASDEWVKYFAGTASHNTIQFDGRDQMPRLGRFLFGEWLKTKTLMPLQEDSEKSSVGVSYRDSLGAEHVREVCLQSSVLTVEDSIRGFKKAVLRWRLPAESRLFDGFIIKGEGWQMQIKGSMSFTRFEIVEGWESLYYLDKKSVPVLEVEVSESGTLSTEFTWRL